MEKAHDYFKKNVNFMLNISPDENGCVDQNLIDTFAEIGKKGVLALLADSTNVERPGFTMSERTVGKTFDNLFAENAIAI